VLEIFANHTVPMTFLTIQLDALKLIYVHFYLLILIVVGQLLFREVLEFDNPDQI